jgi:hypothetical protein
MCDDDRDASLRSIVRVGDGTRSAPSVRRLNRDDAARDGMGDGATLLLWRRRAATAARGMSVP